MKLWPLVYTLDPLRPTVGYIKFKAIRGRGKGHGPVKSAKIAEFKVCLRHLLRYLEDFIWDYDTIGRYLNLSWPDFPVFLFSGLQVGLKCIYSSSSDGSKSVNQWRGREQVLITWSSISGRPYVGLHIFFLIWLDLGVWVKVDQWFTTVWHWPTSIVEVKFTEVSNLRNVPV